MFKKLFFIALTLGLGLYSTESSAQLFRLRVTDYGAAGALSSLIDAEIAKVQTDINKDLPGAPPERLMEGMANSSVMATKGVGTDYASNMDVFLIGAGVGIGADLEKDPTTNSDISGVGVAPGVIVGTNLGWLKSPKILGLHSNRLNVYLNFMSYNGNYQISKETGKESDVDLGSLAMGFHLRYDLVQKRGSKLLGWGGIKVHTGFDYNKTDITFHGKINQTVSSTNIDGAGANLSGTVTGTPTANILATTRSIPLELSTDVQLLYFLSLYGGLAADMNFGQAKGKGNLNADESTLSCSGGACGGGTNVKVQADANIDATGKVNPFIYRGFAGVQINLPYTRIFAQANKAFGNDLVSVTAGLRFSF